MGLVQCMACSNSIMVSTHNSRLYRQTLAGMWAVAYRGGGGQGGRGACLFRAEDLFFFAYPFFPQGRMQDLRNGGGAPIQALAPGRWRPSGRHWFQLKVVIINLTCEVEFVNRSLNPLPWLDPIYTHR